MPAAAPLYDLAAAAPSVPPGLPLVIALTGFTDAGGAVSGLVEYLRDEVDPIPLVTFRNDALLDYRARRPLVSFEQDRLTEYRPQRLELSLARDASDQPFLLLAGYEPDFSWDAAAATVLEFARAFAVSTVTWTLAIPMPVPHTRPIGTTISGTRSDLAEAHSVWRPETQVPATFGHLLEYRFAGTETPVAGFVLLVPHYLADSEYPAAVIAALDSLNIATGLSFDGESLREQNREYVAKVTEQVTDNDDLTRMLHTLEERYDAYMAGATQATPIIHTGDLPSADELAAELERFLASRPSGEDDKRN